MGGAGSCEGGGLEEGGLVIGGTGAESTVGGVLCKGTPRGLMSTDGEGLGGIREGCEAASGGGIDRALGGGRTTGTRGTSGGSVAARGGELLEAAAGSGLPIGGLSSG